MDLTIDDDDAAALVGVLDAALRELNYEIADTDNPEYKRNLRERRERLESLRTKLDGSA